MSILLTKVDAVRKNDTMLAYDEFGVLLVDGVANQGNISNLKNPFGYTGYQTDDISGLNYAQARYYHPLMGRWTQSDPYWTFSNMLDGSNPIFSNRRILPNIGAIQQAGNLYAYVTNNPIMYIDPVGLYRVNFTDYLEAQGATVEELAPSDGRERVSITVDGRTTTWFLNSGYMQDYTINVHFGFESFLTDLDRAHDVGIVITDGNLYRNVTAPVNAALANTATIAAERSPSDLAWFHGQVNHNAPWDIKRPGPWSDTIGSTFPGAFNTPIYFRGYRMTPESLGNWTYGYIGGAQGISPLMLLGGSWFAAGFPLAGDDLVNERGDWIYILRGFDAFSSTTCS
jgi:RHS repeat-associated protein